MTPCKLNEFSVYLDQRPGEMAGVLEAIAAQGVEVRAVWVGEHKGRGLFRILGGPVEALRAVFEHLMESGVGPVVESEVLAFPTYGRPDALRHLAIAMADNRINVRYAYIAPARGDDAEACVIRIDDLDDVMQKIDAIDWPENGHANGQSA